MDFAILADHKKKIKENEKIDKYLDLTREIKKKHESDGDISWSWFTLNGPQRLGKWIWGIRNQRKNRDHPDYSFV